MAFFFFGYIQRFITSESFSILSNKEYTRTAIRYSTLEMRCLPQQYKSLYIYVILKATKFPMSLMIVTQKKESIS